MRKRSIQDTPIAIIGAGNLAYNLAKTLYKRGFRIVQVYSRTEKAASELAGKIESIWTTDIEQITKDASLYIVALKDEVLPELIPQLVQGREKKLWVHTAGSVPMDIWKGYVDRYGVLYPMQTFSKQREVDFNELSIFIEGSAPEETEMLQAVARSLTKKVYEADSERRKKLHLAAVFACNFTNHMYTLSSDILEEAGIPFDAMLPLIDETARKVHTLPPLEAQTGPAVRYDKSIISKHLAMLTGKPYLQELYRLISMSIRNRILK